jgi:hypothetical protein
METGFDASREQLRLGTQAQLASTTAANAFTGLGNTSFGQSSLNAVQASGALQQGLLSERESQMMSDLVGSQGAALFNADQNAAQMLLGAGQNYAQGLANLQSAYTGMQFGGMTTQASNVLNAQTSMAGNIFQGNMGMAQNVGSGFNLGGALIGAGIGAAASWLSPIPSASEGGS